MVDIKKCSRCKQPLSLSSFAANKSKKDGKATECKKCFKEIQLEWREKRENAYMTEDTRYCSTCQKDKPISDFLSYYPYCKECRKERREKRYKEKEKGNPRDRERQKVLRLKRNYSLTSEAYEQKIVQQNGCCAICEQHPKKGSILYVDHSHATGLVRNLLCTHCNSVLGHAHDNPEVLRKAALYLEKHNR